MRIAALADVHVGDDSAHLLRGEFAHVSERADVLLIAGDLTQHGLESEGRILAEALAPVTLPRIAVLGNHDYHRGEQGRIRSHLEDAGVVVLEGESTIVQVGACRIGVAGVKGFGGGFPGACGSEFGEDEMKAFMGHSRRTGELLKQRLLELECELKVALTHYSPTASTLEGERREIYPFLGSYHLGEAIDAAACALAVHGHAHRGTERGRTAGGVPVRNVARPVIRLSYKVYEVGMHTADTGPVSLRPPARL